MVQLSLRMSLSPWPTPPALPIFGVRRGYAAPTDLRTCDFCGSLMQRKGWSWFQVIPQYRIPAYPVHWNVCTSCIHS